MTWLHYFLIGAAIGLPAGIALGALIDWLNRFARARAALFSTLLDLHLAVTMDARRPR